MTACQESRYVRVRVQGERRVLVQGASTGRKVPAVARAGAILDAVARAGQPVTLAQLTRAVGAPKSSILMVCQALLAERLLTRGVDGTYWLGSGIAELASAARALRPVVRRIGISVQSSANAFFAVEIAAARAAAEALGATLSANAAEQDLDAQIRQIEAFIAEGVDLIIVDPVASLGMEAITARARQALIPAVAINGTAAGADAAVTTDNAQAGALIGRHLIRLLPRGGAIAIIDGTPITAIADRIAGFLGAIRPNAGLRVVCHLHGENTQQSGERAARQILREQPVINAFFAINDPTAIGVGRACIDAGRVVPVLSVDGSKEAVTQVRHGGPIVATAAQDPARLARTGMELGVALLAGIQPGRQTILLPTRLITAENAEEYTPWG